MRTRYKYLDPILLAKLSNLNLIARLVVEGFISGLHKSPFKGFSVEFSEYREYSPGDDLRWIDWKVFGKSDKYFIKEFQEETNLKCYIILDTSRSMLYGKKMNKMTYASYLAASLGYLMIRQRDSVGLITFDNKIRKFIPPKSNPTHLKNILIELERIKSENDTNITDAFHNLAERIKRRGLIIVISDLIDEPDTVARGLAHFRHKKHEVIIFHILDKEELDFSFDSLTEFVDLETNEKILVFPQFIREYYQKNINSFINQYKSKCAEHYIDYLPISTATPLDISLITYLSKRTRIG